MLPSIHQTSVNARHYSFIFPILKNCKAKLKKEEKKKGSQRDALEIQTCDLGLNSLSLQTTYMKQINMSSFIIIINSTFSSNTYIWDLGK